MFKKTLAVFLIFVVILTVAASAETTVRGSVARISLEGDAELDRMPQKLLEIIQIGDTALVEIGGLELEMPFVEEPIAEEGKLQLLHDREDGSIYICLYNQSFAEAYGVEVGDRVFITKKIK